MSGERYWIHNPKGRLALPGSLKPSAHALTAVTPNLYRARGYTDVWDLSDGLPDPAPLSLTGIINRVNMPEIRSEADLIEALTDLRRELTTATAYDRDARRIIPIRSASLLAATTDSRDSAEAILTVTLILSRVPDPADPDFYLA